MIYRILSFLVALLVLESPSFSSAQQTELEKVIFGLATAKAMEGLSKSRNRSKARLKLGQSLKNSRGQTLPDLAGRRVLVETPEVTAGFGFYLGSEFEG